ncbi:unnamed protein product [Peronospora destructor]|uniref:Fibronectin type-III domain-containing protein n=1 Tax=Peronospora destructor TaxID=86335 RepID=A0AAV0SXM6_9STRA|nr:unnamed protein product [Peronospora destructor]
MGPFTYLECGVNDNPGNLATDESKYPILPHPPLLVVVGTGDSVVVRWRSFETILWPVERFVLQRYPDRENQLQWSTLLDENASEFVDLNVQCGRKYEYRVQVISRDNVTSAYEYQWTRADRVTNSRSPLCRSSNALLDFVGTLNTEGFRSLGLIFACFLTVYGLMRASVMSVQGTQSRSYRLKRIKKSSEGVTSAVSISMFPRRSSTSTSSSSPSVVVDLVQRGSMFNATTSSTIARTGDMMRRQESIHTFVPSTFQPISRSVSAIDEKATECKHCGKHFGLFRKRYMCDICHSVALCRKCGFQASVNSFANGRTSIQMNSVSNTRASNGGCGLGRRRLSLSQHHQKKFKIRTICKNCC